MFPHPTRRDHRGVSTMPRRVTRADFVRPEEGRMVAGVAAGIADAFGLDRSVVRCGFVILAVASGVGLVLYGIGWALMPVADGPAPERTDRPFDAVATAGFGAVVLGILLFVRELGVWPGDLIVWPLAAALAGLALLAMRVGPANGDAAELPEWSFLRHLPPDAADALAVLIGTKRGSLVRIIAGAGCVMVGIAAFVLTAHSWNALVGAFIASAAVLIGIVLVIGPGLSRLAHAFIYERQERVRADERAEVAAHLHDSVLQTLALVQRRADDPKEVVRLARMQERELRAWLLAGGAPSDVPEASSLGAALEELAAGVESEHGVPVEVVRVRDCPPDGMDSLLLAAREAIVNATRHSGAAKVAVYLEVEPERATVFVRDRGKGFDTEHVPDDRGGITNSIVGRMTRAGGRAAVHSTLGEGTEVELEMPRSKS
jgi:signal transduction histidine kinase/phage shock protein PspC (stress-responsive transcriptional regulator)